MPERSFKNSALTLNPKEISWSLEHLHLAISLQFMYKVDCFKKLHFFSFLQGYWRRGNKWFSKRGNISLREGGGEKFKVVVIMPPPPRKRLGKSLIRPSCKNCCLLLCVIYQSPCISPFISFKSIFVIIMQVLTSISKFLQLLALMFRLCKISFFLHNLFFYWDKLRFSERVLWCDIWS